MPHPDEIITKLWHLCNILRESGITYPEYVTELTYLLFLKMSEETGSEADLPVGFRWKDLTERAKSEQFGFYREILTQFGNKTDGRVREIFLGSETCLNQPQHLALLVQELDAIDWYALHEEGALGNLYEGLLEKNSAESKSGAGQYFTPRPLIHTIIDVIKPQVGELTQDPACGTAGFLIAADMYIKQHSHDLKQLSIEKANFQRQQAFVGVELVQDTHRLALMNAMLHGIQSPIICGDALGEAGEALEPADLILTNPPFGTKRGGGLPSRSLPFPTSNKQLAFLQHIYLGLKRGGRAAVVMPNLQGPAAPMICNDLMDKCCLHTILRLPSGIFYAPGVKTNVLFFTRGEGNDGNTTETWIYDLRANMPRFGKRTPLLREHFKEFVEAYGSKSDGTSERTDLGSNGRFRRFSRQEIRENADSFEITWLQESYNQDNVTNLSPDTLLGEITERLQKALKEFQALGRNSKNK